MCYGEGTAKHCHGKAESKASSRFSNGPQCTRCRQARIGCDVQEDVVEKKTRQGNLHREGVKFYVSTSFFFYCLLSFQLKDWWLNLACMSKKAEPDFCKGSLLLWGPEKTRAQLVFHVEWCCTSTALNFCLSHIFFNSLILASVHRY